MSSRDGGRGAPAWLGAVVDQGKDAVAVFDEDGIIVYANDAVLRHLRYRREDLVGLAAFDLVLPEDLARAAAAVSSVGQGARPRPGLMRLLAGDGTPVLAEMTPWSATLDDGRVVTAVALRDNSLQEAHWQFLTALTAGEPFHRCIEVLADSLSHDSDGPMGIAYDDGGRRLAVGPLAAALSGATADGRLDETPGAPWTIALAEGRAVWGTTDDLPEPLRTLAQEQGGPAYAAVPVTDPGQDRPALLVQWPEHPSMAEMLAEALSRRPQQAVSLALQRRHDLARLEHQATRDHLTGLVNRGQLFAALDRLAASGQPYGICYVDLDHLKPVNDALGHLAGDEVLVECARRLEQAVRPGDVAARLGGDEFAVACAAVTEAGLDAVAAAIVDALAQPFRAAGWTVPTTASVGCALARAGEAPDEAVVAADKALYQAKAAGRATWRRAHRDDPARPVGSGPPPGPSGEPGEPLPGS